MNRGNRGEVERIYFYPTTIERFFWMDWQIAVNPTVPSLKKLQHDVAVEHNIREVAKAGNAHTEDLQDRKTKLKDLRQMAMELSYRYSSCKQKEIGAIFGVDYSTVSQSRRRLKTKLKPSRKLKKQFHRIRGQIDYMSNLKI